MAVTQKRIPLFDAYKIRRRTTGKGTKDRVSVEFETNVLLHELDEFVLGAPAAEAVADVVGDQIRGISKRVSPATSERRQRAYRDGESRWYKRRYAGGRTGETPPDPNSDQWGNDSGRLANGIFVRDNPTDASYTMNVPANRFRQDLFGRGFHDFLRELGRLVPAIGNPASLVGNPRFERGIREATALLITQGKDRGEADRALRIKKLQATRRRAILAIARVAGRSLR